MNLLFDEESLKEITVKKSQSLEITKNSGLPLTKKQKEFNTLLMKIESLKIARVKHEQLLDTILNNYNEKVFTAEKKLALQQIEFAKTLDSTTTKFKFSKSQKEDIAELMNDIIKAVLEKITPPEEFLPLVKKYDDSPTAKEIEEMEKEDAELGEMLKEYLQQKITHELGLDIKVTDYGDSQEEQDRLQNDILEQLEKKKNKFSGKKKKTKKQIEKEDNNKKIENAQLNSLRNIYISLAKVLHPDTETNIEQKAAKEELMKKVTTAYKQKDLTTLLALEMEWIATETSNLQKLTDEKLTLYIHNLKNQVDDLENDLIAAGLNPKYQHIRSFVTSTPKQIEKQFKSMADFTLAEIAEYKNYVIALEAASKKNHIYDIVLLAQDKFDLYFDEFDDDWMPF